jgi:hypothetical protein
LAGTNSVPPLPILEAGIAAVLAGGDGLAVRAGRRNVVRLIVEDGAEKWRLGHMRCGWAMAAASASSAVAAATSTAAVAAAAKAKANAAVAANAAMQVIIAYVIIAAAAAVAWTAFADVGVTAGLAAKELDEDGRGDVADDVGGVGGARLKGREGVMCGKHKQEGGLGLGHKRRSRL